VIREPSAALAKELMDGQSPISEETPIYTTVHELLEEKHNHGVENQSDEKVDQKILSCVD